MALSLPRFEDLFPGESLDLAPRAAPPQQRVFDTLSPQEQEDIRRTVAYRERQQELAANPRGALGEIGTGFVRGAMAGVPRLLGQALKSTGQEGDTLYGLGKSLVGTADANALKYAQDANPGAHGEVVNALSGYVENVAPSVAPMVAGLALAPFTGGASAMAAAGALGAGAFGASQYQDTYEKALKEGKTREEAHALGLQTGAIEAVGEGVGSAVGAKFLTGSGKLLSSAMGIKRDVPAALKAVRDPKFLPTLAKDFAATATVETGTEMGQGAGEAWVEQKAGIDKTTPWEAATSAIGPALTLSVLMAPFGGLALKHQQNRNKDLLQIAEDPNADPAAVAAASSEIAKQIAPMTGKADAAQWRLDTLAASVKSKEERDALAAKAKAETERQDAEEATRRSAEAAVKLDSEQLLATPPKGAMSFEDFSKQYEPQADAAQSGMPFTMPEGKQKAATLKRLYVDYLRTVRDDARARSEETARSAVLPDSQTGQQDLFPAERILAQEPATPPLLTLQPSMFSREPGPTENMVAPEAAAAHAAEVEAQRAAAEGQRNFYSAVHQVISNPPEGMPSFAEYTKKVKAAVKKDSAGGGITEAGLRQGYVQLANQMRVGEQRPGGVTPAEGAQPQLGFEDTLSNKLPVRNTFPAPAAAQPTAMQVALENADAKKQAQINQAWKERGDQTRYPPATPLTDRTPAVDVTRRVNVAAANKLADDALAGKINGNTPVAAADLLRVWKEQHAEKLPLTTLKKQYARQIEMAITRAAGKKLWMQQLKVLRDTRDAMGEKSDTRQSLDALITKLESFNGNQQTQPVRSEGQKQDAGQGPTNAGQGQEGLLKKEVSTFVDTKAAEAPVKAEGAAKADSTPPPVPAEAVPPAPPTVTVNSRGEVVEGPKTPAERRAAQFKSRAPELDAAFEADEDKYDFEHYQYDPRMGPTKGTNGIWINSFVQAQKDLGSKNEKRKLKAMAALAGLTETEREGELVLAFGKERAAQLSRVLALNAKVHEQVQAVRNAQKSEFYREAKKGAFIEAYGRNPKAGELDAYEPSPEVKSKIDAQAEAFADAWVQRGTEESRTMKATGKAPAQNQEKSRAKDASRQPSSAEDLHQTGDPNYIHDEALAGVLSHGNAAYGLEYLSEYGATDWVRDLAHMLMNVNVPLKVEQYNYFAKNEEGKRVYGRYLHGGGTGRIRLFSGGANAHTFLHEVVHGATVAKLLAALKVEETYAKSDQTPSIEEQALLNSLVDLRKVMAWLRKNDPQAATTYGYKNEAEFIAEVFSNESFRDHLSGMQYDARSVTQKIWDWVLGLFGQSSWAYRSALEKAMGVSSPFVSDSRFGAWSTERTFDQSSTAAAQRTDIAVPRLMAEWEKLSAKHNLLADARPAMQKLAMELSSTWNLRKLVARVPGLTSFNKGLSRLVYADEQKQLLKGVSQRESGTVTTPLQLHYASLDKNKAAALDDRLARLAEFSSVHNVELWNDWASNLKRNPQLSPTLRQDFARMQADYKSLPDAARTPFTQSFKVLRKGYIQYTANTLRALLRAYSDENSDVVKDGIKALDITNDTLTSARDNKRPEFFLDSYSYNLDKVIREVLTDLLAKTKGEKSNFRADLLDVNKFYNSAIGNPYAHLGRTGDHFVRVKVAPGTQAWETIAKIFDDAGKIAGLPNSDRQIFARFDNPQQRDDVVKALEAYRNHLQDEVIDSGSLANEDTLARVQGIPAFASKLKRDLATRFKSEQAAALRQYIDRVVLDMLPDTAPQKMMAQRKNGGVGGSDATFLVNFAKRAGAMSSVVATGHTMPLYDEAFMGMKESIRDLEQANPANPRLADLSKQLFDEVNARFSNSISPVHTPNIDAFKAFGFNMFLAFSPAFWLTNLMQPWHLGLPWLGARYGFVNSAKELGKSSGKAFTLLKGAIAHGWNAGEAAGGLRGSLLGLLDLTLQLEQSGLRPDEITFVRQLIESGQLDTTQGHELGHIGEGETLSKRMTMKALSAGSHYTEVFNRLAQGLAGYNLSLKNAKEVGEGPQFAITRGIEGVRETQLDYSDHNVSRALGRHGRLGKVTPLLASFQTYSFQVTELLVRMTLDLLKGAKPEDRVRAAKEIAGVLGTTSVLAGTLGIPFASVISAVIDRVFGSGDDPLDAKTAYQHWLASVFGDDMAEIIARGAPRALGVDTSNRMGLADVLPGSRFAADRRALKDKLEAGAFNLMGPAVSATSNVVTGMGKVMDGYVMDGLIEFSPIALKGPLKAAKMAEHGYTTASNIKLPMEVTPWDIGVQTFGLTPADKAKQSEHNFAFLQRSNLLEQRKTLLANKAMMRIERGEDITQELQDIMLFNQANPQMRIDLASGLQVRAKQRAVAAVSPSGIATLPRFMPTLERYNF